jgi:acetolactate synthase-1/2/3 large subunit
MSAEHTVAAEILDRMSTAGVDTCFGIPGVHNLGFWDALRPGRPRVIGVRHEQAAGYAADGLYRATGRAGAALLTSGPGVANIVAAFGEAFASYSPMLVVASDVGTGLRRYGVTRGILHETPDQAALFAAFGASAHNSGSAREAIHHVSRALASLDAPPSRPEYVGVPSDVLEESWLGPAPTWAMPAPPRIEEAAVARIAEALAASARPLIWVGGGVVSAGAEEAVRRLAQSLGAVAVTSFAGRGLLAGDTHLIDAPVHEPEVSSVLAQADLLLVLGSDFDAMNTKNWKLELPETRIVITLGRQVENTIDWTEVLVADLSAALPILEMALDERSMADRPCWVPDASGLRGRVFDRLRNDVRVAEAVRFTDALEVGWSQDDAIVSDMAVAGFWATLYSYQSRPRRTQYPVGWGTLGYGLPAAMGPASQGIPTLAVCGDGGPMFSLGELATFAQESLPITLLVVDDGGYGMLRFDQQVFGHPERGVDLLTPDWVSLAGAFGISGVEIPDVSALPSALRSSREANGRGEPRLIVWKQRLFPPRTTSPRWFEAEE